MTTFLSRKEVAQIILSLNKDIDIRVIQRLKNVHKILVDTAIRLSKIEFIKYIRITEDEVIASSLAKGTRILTPITEPEHPLAIGIKVVYMFDIKTINFDEINSPVKGCGHKMVDCILTDFPADWQAAVIMDWSGGFWEKMREKYAEIDWMY